MTRKKQGVIANAPVEKPKTVVKKPKTTRKKTGRALAKQKTDRASVKKPTTAKLHKAQPEVGRTLGDFCCTVFDWLKQQNKCFVMVFLVLLLVSVTVVGVIILLHRLPSQPSTPSGHADSHHLATFPNRPAKR
jgi:hypothetical protein